MPLEGALIDVCDSLHLQDQERHLKQPLRMVVRLEHSGLVSQSSLHEMAQDTLTVARLQSNLPWADRGTPCAVGCGASRGR